MVIILFSFNCNVYATGGLHKNTIKTCPNGITYGLHSDGSGGTHWHVAITNDKKATSRIEGNQNKLLIDKVNSFTIIVTAEDGSEKNYLLNITRKETKSNVTIVMGEPDSKTRNAEVTSIFDYVYAQYALNKLVDTNTILKTVAVKKLIYLNYILSI